LNIKKHVIFIKEVFINGSKNSAMKTCLDLGKDTYYEYEIEK